jgi:hypothetical protein
MKFSVSLLTKKSPKVFAVAPILNRFTFLEKVLLSKRRGDL